MVYTNVEAICERATIHTLNARIVCAWASSCWLRLTGSDMMICMMWMKSTMFTDTTMITGTRNAQRRDDDSQQLVSLPYWSDHPMADTPTTMEGTKMDTISKVIREQKVRNKSEAAEFEIKKS